MKRVVLFGFVALFASSTWAFFKANNTAADMTRTATALLESLDEQQRVVCQLPYDSPKRVGWHFIPIKERKGLKLRTMTQPQRDAGHKLLQVTLSKVGYDKTTKIMRLEALLDELEKSRRPGWRDPEKYYFTIFGEPRHDQRWGFSYEGHHLSLNFVIEGEKVVSSTPQFLASNPGVIKNDNKTGLKKGTRVLANEELLAFELVSSLSDEQKSTAVIAEKAPREIRAAGEPQPPGDAPAGLAAGKLNNDQLKTLRGLIEEYARAMPYDVAEARLQAIEDAGFENVHFAWAGPLKEGIGHYYRVQGPSFLIELVNTQPDAAGNPANHVHCVWRDMKGDFAIPLADE